MKRPASTSLGIGALAGAIVKVAAVAAPMPKAGGKWNTYDITMEGTRLILVLERAENR